VNAGKYKNIFMFVFAALVLSAGSAGAGIGADFVSRGNGFYAGGEYNKAIGEYDRALVVRPGSFEPKFNKANSFFRLEDFAQAIDLYRQAAADSRDMQLVAKAKYNLGNCHFQQGNKQKDSDLQKSLENYQASITNWLGVLEIEPENVNAAKNIEVARLTIKDIIDQINKQKQEQEKQEQLKDKLKELLDKQKKLLQDNQAIGQQADSNSISSEQARRDYEDLADKQSQLAEQTSQTAEQLDSQASQPDAAQQQQQVKDELQKAVSQQEQAVNDLSEPLPEQAADSQQKAAEHIENALNSMQQQGQQQQQQNQQGQDQESEQQDQKQDQQQQQEDEQQQQQTQAKAPDQTAEEILDKEQRDKAMRQFLRAGRGKVDKDW